MSDVKFTAPVAEMGVMPFSRELDRRLQSLSHIAANGIRPERLCKIVVASVMRNPLLMQCTGQSLFLAAVRAAELGLEPDSALGEAYIVPFKNTATLMIGYQGFIGLAYRSQWVKSIYAEVVHEGDEFAWERGTTPRIKHVPADTVDRTDARTITHAYCVVELVTGGVIFDVMTRAEIDKVRDASRGRDSVPWAAHYAEMAKKTVARRLIKYVPKSVEMSKALAIDAAAETGEPMDLGELETVDTEAYAEEQPKPKRGVAAVKEKLEIDETTALRNSVILALSKISDSAKRTAIIESVLNGRRLDSATHDELLAIRDAIPEPA